MFQIVEVYNDEEDRSITPLELQNRCRTCLTNDGVINIFTTKHKDVMLTNIFRLFSLPEMDPLDTELPQKICGACAKILFEFYAFKQLSEQSQAMLQIGLGKFSYLKLLKPETQLSKQQEERITTDNKGENDKSSNIDCNQETIENNCINPNVINTHSNYEEEKVLPPAIPCLICNLLFTSYAEYINHKSHGICQKEMQLYKLEDNINLLKDIENTDLDKVDIKIENEEIQFSSSNTHNEVTTDHDYIMMNELLICNVCGKGFDAEHQLNFHKHDTHLQKPHLCKICGKRFAQVGPLQSHLINVHTPKKRKYGQKRQTK